MQDDLDHLAQRLINDVDQPKLKRHKAEHKRIKKYYSPRERFNRWRDSEEGKAWKLAQYQAIDERCPACGHWFSIGNLEIDHIEAIATAPSRATDTKNLRLLCSACNKKKSSSTAQTTA